MNTVEMLGRLLVSLAVVLGVVWVIARRAKKGVRGRSDRTVEIIDRATLSRSASVAVVRVNDQAFVLGVADAGVSLLGETDLAAVQAARETLPGSVQRGRRRATTRPARTTRPIGARPAAAAVDPRRVVDPVASGRENGDHSAVDRPLESQGGARNGTKPGALAGSALSPQTWKQTIESLRDLTARP